MKRADWIIYALAGIAAIVISSCVEDVLLYNHSPSIPVGFYVRRASAPHRGSIVTVRAIDVAPGQARVRHFTDRDDRFIKRVAASDGDTICAAHDSISINGRPVALRRSFDSSGRALPSWLGCQTLGPNQFFLLGDTTTSFDSRYWGPVTRSEIEGVWRPL